MYPSTKYHSGNLKICASDIGILSKSGDSDAKISLISNGSSNDGNINITSNGGAQMAAGDATLSVNSQGDGSATLDAGPSGTAIVSAGNPAVPQIITLDGGSALIKIVNGALPICPMIEMTPESIKLSAGPTSSIEISPEGVTIQGLMVSVKGTAETSVEGAMVSVKGSGMTTVAGGIIMIG